MKHALALVLSAACVLGLFLVLRDPAPKRTTEAAVPDARGDESEQAPPADLALDEEDAEPEERESAPENERAAVPKEAAPEPESQAEPDNQGVVFGRCIDFAEEPIAGVLITGTGVPGDARTAEDGSFRLAIDLGSRIERTNRLVFSFVDLGVERRQPIVRAEIELDLGDIVLLPAATLSGRVVDREGNGVDDAGVRLQKAGELSHGSRFSGPSGDYIETRSTADGSFLLEGVPAGGVELWAGKEGWFWTRTELAVEAGSTQNELELVIAKLEAEDTIEFIVVDPGGDPVPHADITYSYRTRGRSGSGSTSADENGSFRQFLDVRAKYSFQAQDPEQVFRPGVIRDVAPGARGLVIQLGRRVTTLLTVVDPDGEPVEKFSAKASMVEVDFFGTTHVPPGNDTLAPGQAEIVVPPESFELTITAEGFEVANLGPFEPEATPSELRATLVALPGIHGRILSAEGPVAGAEVSLHGYVGNRELSVNGFPCVSERWSESSTESGPDGSYFLTLRESGEWIIRAEAPGHAPAVTEPGHFEASIGARDLDLVLGSGGSIEGRVLLPAGEEKSGRLIGLSRGDGFGFTGRTDAQGRFRFDRLTPGPWQVVGRTEEIRTGSTTSSSGSGERDPIRWDCHVQEGRTTHFDVDLRQVEHATLEGTLLLGGSAPTDWFVSLDSEEGEGIAQASGRIDPNGNFSLTVEGTGKFRLTFMGRLGENSISGTTHLRLVAGKNEFEADVPTGQLVVRFLPELFSDDSSLVASSSSANIRFHAFLSTNDSGILTLDRFPAGAGKISFETTSGEEGSHDIIVPKADALEVTVP